MQYEDGDTETMSVAIAKRYIKPEGSQPPEGVIILEPATTYTCLLCGCSNRVRHSTAVVPPAAVELLAEYLQESMQSTGRLRLHDPISSNMSLQLALAHVGLVLSLDQPTGTQAGTIIACEPESFTIGLAALQQLQTA